MGRAPKGAALPNYYLMKKYITPNIEYTPILLTGHILGVSQDNQDVMTTTPQTGGLGPNQIGKRVF